MDFAGNGPTASKIYNITVNSPPRVIIDSPSEDTDYTSNKNIFFNTNSTFDPDPQDKLTFDWSSNITKFLGSSKYFYHSLPAGVHEITLTVSDDHGHLVTTTKVITVNKYQIDTDGDNLPDVTDYDDDGDFILDILDAFPLDPTESIDTDGDGIGNNKDPDDDNDKVPDEKDAYPLDPKRSEKETGLMLNSPLIILIIVIIIVLIAVGAVISVRRKRKKQAELAAAAAELTSSMPASSIASAAMQSTRIQDAQVEMVGGAGTAPSLSAAGTGGTVPLLPGTVGSGTAAAPQQVLESEIVPQHLVRAQERAIPEQSVQSYIPPMPETVVSTPTTPAPVPTPTTAVREQIPTPPVSTTTIVPPSTMTEQPQAQPPPQPQEQPIQQQTQQPPQQQPPTTPEPSSEKSVSIPGLTPAQQKAAHPETKKDNEDEI
jgi:hypothetical protein